MVVHVCFARALDVLARVPPIANFFCLCDWEQHAYRRAKRAFIFAQQVQVVVLTIIVEDSCNYDPAWNAFVSATKYSSSSTFGSVTDALSSILSLLQRVIFIKDPPRMVHRALEMPDKVGNDIVTEVLGGHVDGQWKQMFDVDDLERSSWKVFPRILRLVGEPSGARRMLNLGGVIYMPIIALRDTDATFTPLDPPETLWTEVIFGIMPRSPFMMS
jgi:hypothetical protein